MAERVDQRTLSNAKSYSFSDGSLIGRSADQLILWANYTGVSRAVCYFNKPKDIDPAEWVLIRRAIKGSIGKAGLEF